MEYVMLYAFVALWFSNFFTVILCNRVAINWF